VGRARPLNLAYALTPERFVKRPPRPPELPKAGWINKPDPHNPTQRRLLTEYQRRPSQSA
jgi:putative transposase